LAAVVIAGGAGAFGYTQASVQAVDDRVDRAVDTNNDQNQRLAVVETQYLGIKEQLNRMEATLDRLDKERRDGNR
jgi:predicted metalloprotease